MGSVEKLSPQESFLGAHNEGQHEGSLGIFLTQTISLKTSGAAPWEIFSTLPFGSSKVVFKQGQGKRREKLRSGGCNVMSFLRDE